MYVHGVPELSYSDKAGKFELKKGQAVFFQDDGGEHTAGFVKNVRVYDRVLVPS